MFALLFVVICDQMPLRRPQESLWLRQSLKIRTTLETLSSKSTKSTKRTLNLYFQTRDQPRAASDLPWRKNAAEHACINYRWTESGVLYRWPFSKAGEQVDVEVTGPLTMNDVGLTVEAALAGLGLACTLESNITQELAQGRLVRVLEGWCPPSPGFYLYYPSGRLLSAAFRAFIDFMHSGEDVSS